MGFRQAKVITVNSFRAADQGQTIGKANELDDDVFLVIEVAEPFLHLFNKCLVNLDCTVAVMHRGNQILYPGAFCVSVDIPEFTNRLDATNFDRLYFVLNQELFQPNLITQFVVPYLDFNTSILRPARSRTI